MTWSDGVARARAEGKRGVDPIVKAIGIPLGIAYGGGLLGMTAVDGHPAVAALIAAWYVAMLVVGIKARLAAAAFGKGAGALGGYRRSLALLLGFIFLVAAMMGAYTAMTGRRPIVAFAVLGIAIVACTVLVFVAGRRRAS